MTMIMIYTDLLLWVSTVVVLFRCWKFTVEVHIHVTSLRKSVNRVRERIHLYAHIWIVASGLIAVISCLIIQTLHIYYQDVMHDASTVLWLEHWMNITLALTFLAYGNALNHFRAEERAGSSVSYYSLRPQTDRHED